MRPLKPDLVALTPILLGGTVAAQCPLDRWLASDGMEGDRFGSDVALDGDLALVGAGSDKLGTVHSAGSAYVFRRQGGQWVEEQKLVPPTPLQNNQFGLAVAIDGDVAVCGVPNDETQGFWVGSVEVFRFDGATWQHEQQLVSAVPFIGARFGWAVDVEGDRIVVGARAEDSVLNSSGAAYVFSHDGSSWIQDQRLVPPDPAPIGEYGHAVATSGDVVVVGAWRDDDFGIFTGAAYVYREIGGSWVLEQKLIPLDAGEFYRFGASVGIDGDTIVCGAYEARVGNIAAGAAYVYERLSGIWTEQAKLVASDTDAADNFGWSVDITGELVAVGSRRDATPLIDSGSIYLYRRNAGVWSELVKFPSAAGSGGQLGQSISASGERVLAGGWIEDSPTELEAGAAHLFSASEGCSAGVPFCDCTSGAPCGNGGGAQAGCANSTGGGASLEAQGSNSVGAGDLALTAGGLPPGTALFFQGETDLNGGLGSPLGDGLLCAGGTIVRLGVLPQGGGNVSFPNAGDPSIATTGGVQAGDARVYQLWYRDVPGPCSSGFNLTNAVAVDWGA